jgi:hypothetical protein
MSSDLDSDDHPMEGDAAAPVDVDATLQNDDPDTLRVLLSTDKHLGYAERDNIRGMDSSAAFEEVLYTAKRFQCVSALKAPAWTVVDRKADRNGSRRVKSERWRSRCTRSLIS